jgi:hypothetical protein
MDYYSHHAMTIRVNGLDEAIRDIRKKGKQAERAVIEQLEDTAANIEFFAKQDAPFGDGLSINQRINAVVYDGGLKWIVGVQGTLDIDAYYEFGTGLSAKEILANPDYTQEMRDLAYYGFYKNGLGTLRGTPYLFPNYIKYTANLVEEIRKEIEKAIK